MNYNIINEYIDFIKSEYLNFYKIVLKTKYQKKLIIPFLERYISIRYYEEGTLKKEKDIVEWLNKELELIYKQEVTKENSEDIKNVFAIFSYILYFDDVIYVENIKSVIDYFICDENIKIIKNEELKKEITSWYRNLQNGITNFISNLESKDFYIDETRIKRKLYYPSLNQNVKISYLYSQAAIDKVFKSGTILEDKLFVLYIMTSALILNSARSLDFSRNYILDFVPSLLEKPKKCERLFKVIDNTLTKKKIQIKIEYSEFIKNEKTYREIIKNGYQFCVVIDNSFDDNFENLSLFTSVLVNKDSEEASVLQNHKEQIFASIIKI